MSLACLLKNLKLILISEKQENCDGEQNELWLCNESNVSDLSCHWDSRRRNCHVRKRHPGSTLGLDDHHQLDMQKKHLLLAQPRERREKTYSSEKHFYATLVIKILFF